MMKLGKKKRRIIINIFIVLLIFICTIFKSELFDNLEGNINNVLNDTSKTEKVKVDNNLLVYFIDVGQADSILIRNDNYTMLIDAGNNLDGEKLVNYIKSLGISRLNYVVATHAHEDHIGGMNDIINNFKIDKFYMPDVISTTKTFEDMLDALSNNNLKYNTPTIDEQLKLGNAILNILHVGNSSKDLNDSSIVLKLTFGNNTFLFMGDATSEVEKQLLEKNISSDVLKVGHHGSKYSTSKVFLDKVNPKYAVISVGLNNSYDHPNKVTLDKLEKRNIKLYRTDKNGTIIFNSDGNKINVNMVKTDTNG